MKKKVLVCFLAALMLCVMCTQPAAAVTPRWVNTAFCNYAFAVVEPGVAYVEVDYMAYEDSGFVAAMVQIDIEKRVLGLFWRTVDIGYEDNVWTEYCYDLDGFFSNSFEVDGTGTYRANFRITIVNEAGTADFIEDTVQRTYG